MSKTTALTSAPGGHKSIILLDAVTAATTSDWAFLGEDQTTAQATVVGTGALTASVNLEYSNDRIAALSGFTIALAGNTSVSDGDLTQPKWTWVRADLTSITGTGAKVTVTVGA